MAVTTLAPRTRRARAALFAVFGLNGMLAAVWIVHIPAVTERTGTSHTTLGMLILLMAGCAIVGMQAAGPLADRFGSRALTTAAALELSLALLGPAFAGSTATLALALAAFGFGNGALDVSMNAQAVHVERAYPRPIMSAFHAFFSCGGFLGSAAGAATQQLGWTTHLTLPLFTLLGLTITALATPRLLGHAGSGTRTTNSVPAPAAAMPLPTTNPARGTIERLPPHTGSTPPGAAERSSACATGCSEPQHNTDAEQAAEPLGTASERKSSAIADCKRDRLVGPRLRRGWRRPRRGSQGSTRKVLALGGIAFALLMAEGVAADWSALQLRDRLDVGVATAGLAYAGFSLTMTGGRFCADRASGRVGRVAVVRWGTALAAIGFALVVASGWLPLTLAGWALCGIGLSGCVPQVFSAAGNLGSAAHATDMSRVFGLGYVGLLAGPAIIGWINKLVPLTTAMLVPLVAMVLCAIGARAVGTATAGKRSAGVETAG
ncbi:MFS transporter [Nocardia sp. NPDC020380]|uniref:MFS transporter n=1 Tax=Nocardia sp. NPDC020380 TaxID=3364309 RepID=UPI00379836F0